MENEQRFWGKSRRTFLFFLQNAKKHGTAMVPCSLLRTEDEPMGPSWKNRLGARRGQGVPLGTGKHLQRCIALDPSHPAFARNNK